MSSLWRAPGSIKGASISGGGIDVFRNDVESLHPDDWAVVRFAFANDHWVGDPTRLAQSVFSLLLKFSDRMVCPPRRGCHTRSILFGKCFGTVFAKLDFLSVAGNRLRPSATWTVNTVGLIHSVHGADVGAQFGYPTAMVHDRQECRGLLGTIASRARIQLVYQLSRGASLSDDGPV